MVTWDERKRQANLRQHGLDFEGCEAVFDDPVVTVEDSRMAYGEQRIKYEARYYFKVLSHEP